MAVTVLLMVLSAPGGVLVCLAGPAASSRPILESPDSQIPTMTCTQGKPPGKNTYPSSDKVFYQAENGKSEWVKIPVEWDLSAVDFNKAGTYRIEGSYSQEALKAHNLSNPDGRKASLLLMVQGKMSIEIESAKALPPDKDGNAVMRIKIPLVPEEAFGLYLYYSFDQVNYNMASWLWAGSNYNNYLDHYVQPGNSQNYDYIIFKYKTDGRPVWFKVEMKVNDGNIIRSVMSKPVKCLENKVSDDIGQIPDNDESFGGGSGGGVSGGGVGGRGGGQGTFGREEIHAGSSHGGPGVSQGGSAAGETGQDGSSLEGSVVEGNGLEGNGAYSPISSAGGSESGELSEKTGQTPESGTLSGQGGKEQGGARPSRDGTLPLKDGTHPTKSGDYPDKDGNSPTKNDSNPERDSDSPTKDGFNPAKDGTHPAKDGARSAKDSARPSTDGTHSTGDGAGSKASEEGEPSDSENAPVSAGDPDTGTSRRQRLERDGAAVAGAAVVLAALTLVIRRCRRRKKK